MKNVILIWFAISLTIYLLFNVELDGVAYINNFSNAPNFLELLTDFKNEISNIGSSWHDVGNMFNNVNSIREFAKAFGQIFVAFGQSLKSIFYMIVVIPTKLLFYILKLIFIFIPTQFKEVPIV